MKSVTFLIALSLWAGHLAAQVCQPAPNCSEAPIACGFALENGIFNNAVPWGGGVDILDSDCGIDGHNTVWFRVVACESNFEMVITALSTQTGDGLQVALLEGCDSPPTVVLCNEGIQDGAFFPLTLSGTVTPGQEYWLMIDGYIGDVCTFEIDILSGIDEDQPTPPDDEGPFPGTIASSPSGNAFCGAGLISFTASWPDCANWEGYGTYSCGAGSCEEDNCAVEWTIPPCAQILGDPCAATILVDFSSCPTGPYIVTAKPHCSCDDYACPECGQICCPALPVSKPVFITAPQVVFLPTIWLCPDEPMPDCVLEPQNYFNGFDYGVCYSANTTGPCTQYAQPYRIRFDPIVNNLGQQTFCDTFWICGTPYTESGFYSEFCTTPTGCDSIVNVLLVQDCSFVCDALNQPAPLADSCHLAPFFCGNYLDNYCGSNVGLSADLMGGAPAPNAGFLRLAPCSDSLVLRVAVGNCAAGGTGLQFSLLAGDCGAAAPIFVESVNNFQTNDLIFNDLTPNEPYTLAVSSLGGNGCQFNIEVLEGMGTADPGPVTCDCSDGGVQGPAELCPGDVATYTLTLPSCSISVGAPTGGNGEYCAPPEACPPADSTRIVWHIPAGTHFVGDSTGLTVQIQVDSSYFDLDTLRTDSVWVSWELIPSEPSDSLTFCDCAGTGCGGAILPKPVTIRHDIEERFCVLTCVTPTCEVEGIIYTAPGTYVQDVSNCLRLAVTVSGDFAPPFLQATGDQICEGGSAVLSVSAFDPNLFFNWGNGQTGPSITVAPSVTTSYQVVATNAQNGCTAQSQATVVVIPLEYLDFGQVGAVSCAQPCVEFQGQFYCQPGSYFLQTGACSEIIFSIGIDPSLPTTTLPPVTICEGECYDFFGQSICSTTLATTTQNCSLVVQQINVLPLQTLDLGVVGTVSCAQPCFNFEGQDYCQPGVYTLPDGLCQQKVFEIIFQQDTLALGEVGTISCAQPCVSFEGQNYCQSGSYTVEDACSVRHFSVAENTALPSPSPAQHNCLPSNTHFQVIFSVSGQPPFKVNGSPLTTEYYFSPPQPNGAQYAFIVEQNNGCQTVVAGTYNCASMCATDAGTLSAEMLHGCAAQTAVQAQSLAAPTLAPGDVQEFVLTDAAGAILTRNNTGIFAFDATAMTVGTTYFVARVVGPPNANGQPDPALPCTQTTGSQPLIFHALPAVTLSGDPEICEGKPLTINAQGASTYLWNDGTTGPDWAVESANATHAGTRSVVGTDAHGCTGSAVVSVDVWATPLLEEVLAQAPRCYGDTDGSVEVLVVQNGLAPLTFSLNGSAFSEEMLFENLPAGPQRLVVRDANGCESDSTLTLTAPAPVTLDIGPDRQIKLGETVELTAQTNILPSSLEWASDDNQRQRDSLAWRLKPLRTMLVNCVVTDSNGCSATDQALILVEISTGIFRPNTIQFNAENVDNQYFTLFATDGLIQNIESLSVYDRWGGLIWQRRDFAANVPSQGWDGTQSGKQNPPGVYLYMAVVRLANGERQTLQGDVTLMR
jgi:hypothetical protein